MLQQCYVYNEYFINIFYIQLLTNVGIQLARMLFVILIIHIITLNNLHELFAHLSNVQVIPKVYLINL